MPLALEGSISAGAFRWRQGARAFVTLIAKASFDFGTGAALVLRPPRPLASPDGLTGDLAPFKPRAEILFRGQVHAPGRSVGIPARLALLRGGAPVLERRLYVVGDVASDGRALPCTTMPLVWERARGGPGDLANPDGTATPSVVDAARPQRPACLAPVPASFPVRSAQLTGASHERVGEELVLSDPFPWPFFQEAVYEQQVERLLPGDEVVLEHLSARSPRLRFALDVAPPRFECDGRPVPPVLDTLLVDGEAGVIELAWRAMIPLAATARPSLAVRYPTAIAALETAGVDVSKVDAPLAPFLQKAATARGAAQPPPAPSPPPSAPPPSPAPPGPALVAPAAVEPVAMAPVAVSSSARVGEPLSSGRPPAAPPSTTPPEDRLRRAGLSSASAQSVLRALAFAPPPPPPEEE